MGNTPGKPKGSPKSGGRQKGTPNHDTIVAQMKAKQADIDPFMVLLYIVAGDWKKLGYERSTQTYFTSTGVPVEEPVITIDHRLSAAKEACSYLLPKRKALDHTIANQDETSSFRIEIVDAKRD